MDHIKTCTKNNNFFSPKKLKFSPKIKRISPKINKKFTKSIIENLLEGISPNK